MSDVALNGWESWGRHILSELERLNTNIESLKSEMEKGRLKVNEDLGSVKQELAVMKTDCSNCKKDMSTHINSGGWWRNGIIANAIVVLILLVGFVNTWSVLKYRVEKLEAKHPQLEQLHMGTPQKAIP